MDIHHNARTTPHSRAGLSKASNASGRSGPPDRFAFCVILTTGATRPEEGPRTASRQRSRFRFLKIAMRSLVRSSRASRVIHAT